jgi:hypothetical protein
MASRESALLRDLRRNGVTLTQARSGHFKVTHSDAPGVLVVLAASPSDHRSVKNALAQLRRSFGYGSAAASRRAGPHRLDRLSSPQAAKSPPDARVDMARAVDHQRGGRRTHLGRSSAGGPRHIAPPATTTLSRGASRHGPPPPTGNRAKVPGGRY